jgi:16S rRNA (adenine1518-N6/adenine1519-N6)-dimethyltransferase
VPDRAPAAADRLRVIAADALAVTAGELSGEGPEPVALVANLPYNVAVPVLLTLLERVTGLRSGLVMVQAEVADRLAAGPGEPAYGVPSVKAAWYAEVRRAGSVPRQVFWPVPKVESGLVAFTCRKPPVTTASRAQVFACIDAAFAQRRKTLRAALAGWANVTSDRETPTEVEKTYKAGNRTVHEKQRKDGGSSEYTVLLANGVVVEAQGDKVDVAALKKVVEGVDLGKVESLKRAAK